MHLKYKTYLKLAKSGIVLLVLISVLSGYLIGAVDQTRFDWQRLLITLAGILCLAAGSSSLNQIQEWKIDAQMPRTASRPLPNGDLNFREAAIFSAINLVLGLWTLCQVSDFIFFLGTGAVLFYNGFYTLWWKKHWAHAAVPGAIPGAIPVLIGYASATHTDWSLEGIYLFFILFFWQMPHFWSLALRYEKDYAIGGFPTLPVKLGKEMTHHQILLWSLAYTALVMMGPLFLRVRWIYLSITFLMSAQILRELFLFQKSKDDKRWLSFFLWINFSLIIYLAAAALDLWIQRWRHF